MVGGVAITGGRGTMGDKRSTVFTRRTIIEWERYQLASRKTTPDAWRQV